MPGMLIFAAWWFANTFVSVQLVVEHLWWPSKSMRCTSFVDKHIDLDYVVSIDGQNNVDYVYITNESVTQYHVWLRKCSLKCFSWDSRCTLNNERIYNLYYKSNASMTQENTYLLYPDIFIEQQSSRRTYILTFSLHVVILTTNQSLLLIKKRSRDSYLLRTNVLILISYCVCKGFSCTLIGTVRTKLALLVG